MLHFKEGQSIYAEDIDLTMTFINEVEIEMDQYYFIVGPNGIGKSTFARCLSGLYSSNLVGFEKTKVLYHPQDLYFMPGTVNNNLDLFATIKKIDDYYNSCPSSLSSLLKELDKKNIYELSGGEKQIIMLFRTLIVYEEHRNSTNAIILDEPSKQMSSEMQKKGLSLLSSFNIKHPLIIISHDFNYLEKLFEIAFNNNKIVSFIEFKEASNKKVDVEYIGSIRNSTGEGIDSTMSSDWNNIVNKSKYIKSMFGILHDRNMFKPTEESDDPNMLYHNIFSIPTYNGLFKSIVDREETSYEVLLRSPYHKDSNIHKSNFISISNILEE